MSSHSVATIDGRMTTSQNKSDQRRGAANSPLQESFRFLQRVLSPRARSRTWVRDVESVIADLKALNSRTETGFVEVGGNLMGYLTASRQLHSDILGLTALVSGEHVQHACDALLLVRGYVQDIQCRSQDGGRSLQKLKAAAGRIQSGFSNLNKVALSFHITAVLARIETAHLSTSREDLQNLASQVLANGAGIQAGVEQVLEATAAFESRVVFTLAEILRMDALQNQELPALLAAVDADLELFSAHQREALQSSSRLASELDSVSRDLGAIATAIQFHDITRQQIEHVTQALAELLYDTPRGAVTPAGAVLARVQGAQLKSAAAAFARSSQEIDLDLKGIVARVGAMAAVSTGFIRVGSGEGVSFLTEMQRRFAAISDALGESQVLDRATRTIVADLNALSRRVRTPVAEVRTIEFQLTLISINAAISACQLGAKGEPLNVVAGAMRNLQSECASRSDDAEADLDSINEAILSLSASHSAYAGEDSHSTLLGQLEKRVEELHAAAEASTKAISAVAADAESLCGRLQAARDFAGMVPVFLDTVTRSLAALDSVATQAQSSWFFQSLAAVPGTEEHYTMQVERDTHRSIVEGTQPLKGTAEIDDDGAEFF